MADRQSLDAETNAAAHVARPSALVHRQDIVINETSPKLDSGVLEKLKSAVLNPEPGASRDAMHAAIAAGTTPEDLADIYIPAIARDLGDAWCVDHLSFASVTIGASRLQAMMRDMSPNWTGDNAADPATPSILLLVAQEVYHTLGAIVLASQLRRKGFSVKLILGVKTNDLAERLKQTNYQAVFLSSSRGETLESLRRIVDVIKTSTHSQTPVVVGGTILDVETTEDVTALTGADYATRIPDEALNLCGLHVIEQDKTRVKNGT